MKAIVYKSTGSWYTLRDEQGRFWNGRMKGVLKLDDITSTNPVAVGDWVEAEIENEDSDSATINEILDRHNYINRQSPRHKHQHHIVAANLDQSVLIATLKEPRTSQGFIDRFLVASEMYHVPAIIAFNKSDLYKQKELDKYEGWKAMYEKVGYHVLLVSAEKEEGLEELKEALKDKTSLLSGHSGVGKSSLLNVLFPGTNRKTQDVSGWSGKGQHTTTFAEMFELPFGGFIIDTPGIKEFGVLDFEAAEVAQYFPEMEKRMHDCRFNNCLHINEPGCAVKAALENGDIAMSRYENYLSIIQELNTDEKIYD